MATGNRSRQQMGDKFSLLNKIIFIQSEYLSLQRKMGNGQK